MTNFNLLDIDTAGLTVQATAGLDAAGNPGVFAGTLSWSVDDATIATVTPSADGLQGTIARVGTTGVATVSVNTPVGMGSETFEYSGVLSSSEMEDFIVVPTQTGYSNNKSGNVQVYSTNTSVVGTSSTFTTDYYVGDIIYTSSQYKTITSKFL